MGLEVEEVEERKRYKPVADYVGEREDGEEWIAWLQGQRVELNAMTTAELMAWLDAKMGEHGSGKFVPPDAVLEATASVRLRESVHGLVRTARRHALCSLGP